MTKPLNSHNLYFQDMQEINDFISNMGVGENDEVHYYSKSVLFLKDSEWNTTSLLLVIGKNPEGAQA